MKRGTQIVLTAPFTEMIDHAGYFIQMGMASIPIWMEWVMDKKYPEWRNVKRFEDGSAHAAPAGLRVLERVMAAEFGRDNVVVCYPHDLDQFIGPDTRIVALSTHNPLGVTFAAGVYTSIFGSSREPINSHYAANLFDAIKANPHRESFRVLLGGSGSWQVTQTKSMERLRIDCVIDGRSESAETIALFHRAIAGGELPQHVEADHPTDGNTLLFPDRPTTFGVVEMTTGCGRRCQFCVPDLNPQIDLPKEGILDAVRANVVNGNKQISLATEDMFIWGQVRTRTPFFFPNREALVDLYRSIVETRNLSRLQWQLILRCWKMNMRPGLYSWWGPTSFKIGGVGLWALRLRKTNGPNFTWPMMMFCSALPENLLYAAGKLYKGRPIKVKTRAELLASTKPNYWKYLREDAGDIPAAPPPPAPSEAVPQLEAV